MWNQYCQILLPNYLKTVKPRTAMPEELHTNFLSYQTPIYTCIHRHKISTFSSIICLEIILSCFPHTTQSLNHSVSFLISWKQNKTKTKNKKWKKTQYVVIDWFGKKRNTFHSYATQCKRTHFLFRNTTPWAENTHPFLCSLYRQIRRSTGQLVIVMPSCFPNGIQLWYYRHEWAL